MNNWKLKIKIPIIILTLSLLVVGLFQFEFKNQNDKSAIFYDSLPVEPSYIGPKIAPLKLGDNKSIEFPHTDENSDESLIIKSDQEHYTGDSGSDVYFSVTNISKKDESAILLFYFPGQFIPNRDDPPGTQPATVTSLEQRERDSWRKLEFFAKNIKINDEMLGKAITKRKLIPEDFVVKAGTQIEVKAGQTVYFKSRISFRSIDSGEFWIETLGKNGGYGLLDPTYSGTHFGSQTSTDSVISWFASGSLNWTNRKKITVDYRKVSGGSNLSNFPVLISMTDNTLATTANGGKAASGSGEFVFTSSNGTTVLPHEIETYSATTGQFIGWVNVTTLSATADTYIYIYYGGPAAGTKTNQRKQATWNTNYKGVWHLPNGTTLTALDSTSNNNNGTLVNTPTATTGQIDGGVALASADVEHITVGDAINPEALTYSAWVKATSFPTAYNVVISRISGGVYSQFFVKSNGKLAVYMGVSIGDDLSYDGTGSYTLSTNTWYYVTATYDSSAGIVGYVDGAVDATVSPSGTLRTNIITTFIGRDSATTPREWNGVIDEARISDTTRSSGWVKTEYNNQFQPSKFFSLGGLEARIPANPGLKIKGGVKFR